MDILNTAQQALRRRRDLFENVAREFIERHAMKSNRPATWRETARILGLRPSKADPKILIDIGGDVMPAWKGRRIQDISKRDVIAAKICWHVNQSSPTARPSAMAFAAVIAAGDRKYSSSRVLMWTLRS